jgi:ABC-2 type transport system ATP-binding protein
MSGLDPIGRREVRDLIQSLKDEGKTVFFSTHILADAEALCDRVGVLHQGELRGVGAVAELTAGATGKVEIVYEGGAAAASLAALGAELHRTGAMGRALLPEAQLDAAIDALRRARARLVSVTPVRATLEEYFVQKLAQSKNADRTPAQSASEMRA